MKKLTEYTMEEWQKISLFISIISGLSVIITVVPLWLGVYLKFPFFYNLINLNKVKTFNMQGYIFYRPLVGKTNIVQPDEQHAWFLATNRKDTDDAIESIKSLRQGDILFYALNRNFFLRTEPTLDEHQKLQRGRPLFFIKEGQCAVLLENGKDVINDHKERLRPFFYYYVDENKKDQTFTEGNKQEMDKSLAETNKKLKEAKKENAQVKILE